MSVATRHHPAVAVRLLPVRPAAVSAPGAVPKSHCSGCHLREVCLPGGMECSDVERLDALMFGRRRVKAGRALYRAGDPFEFIYAVRSGTFKSSLQLPDGREQVSGFSLGGEVMGLDGVAQGRHASNAAALEDAEVCAIPYAHLIELSAANAGMQHVVSRLMSLEILREHSLLLLLGSMSAEERVAAFLLNLSQRLQARGYSPSDFHLRMSRAEIGSYLGLKLETVSRTFSRLQQQRLLEVDKRHIRIADMEGLSRAFGVRMH